MGWTPLHISVEINDAECMEILLSSGADIDARDYVSNLRMFH